MALKSLTLYSCCSSWTVIKLLVKTGQLVVWQLTVDAFWAGIISINVRYDGNALLRYEASKFPVYLT